MGHRCVALTLRVKEARTWQGVRILPYSLPKRPAQAVHPWLVDFDSKVTRGEACWRAAMRLRERGYVPDLILAHPGWGESLFLRDVWPGVRIGLYCELYHLSGWPHLNFDPEFPSPAPFQADTFPQPFRDRITVSHDGIDTVAACPQPDVRLEVEGAGELSREDEVITFVNRNLEPYRGYHVFMRALPRLLRERPRARVLIVGGDEVSYGARPPKGQTWKQIFIDEVRDRIPDADWARVHFLGRIPYDRFLRLLQLSRVHVYLTYPFVLSWSLMEAMSCGAAIVAGDTAPVREVITHDVTGRLVDFFDGAALVDEVCALLNDEAARRRLGVAARELIRARYDLQTICLPRQVAWVSEVAEA